MIDGITYIEPFIEDPTHLFALLESSVNWDERMTARKTASYGRAYNYSQIEYPFQPFLPELEQIIHSIGKKVGYVPNNCLINYYTDGKSKMGFHSDQTDIWSRTPASPSYP
jgi:alkylated DNA repair dioxygenase AlkB